MQNPLADARLGFEVADTVRDPLLVLDATFRVVAANRAFYATFRVDEAETRGCRLHELGNGQWDIPALRTLLEEVLATDRAFDDFEVDHVFDGLGRRIMWLNARTLVAAGPHGRLVLLAIADVTERRRIEAELEHRERELARSNGDLEQFATVASHDLQEPLRKIQTYGELLRTECAPQLDAEGREYIERMANAAGRMRRLIDDLLALSRVTTRPRPLMVVDLDRVLRDVLADLDVVIREADARIDLGVLPSVHADPAQMRHLFQNLLSNSLKFRHPERAPMLAVRSAHAPDVADHVEILVVDNGIGFAQEQAEEIFRPFARLHPSSRFPGTGVGLAICQRVVERHGGTIRAESTPGRGTTIRVSLPIAVRPQPATSAAPTSAQ